MHSQIIHPPLPWLQSAHIPTVPSDSSPPALGIPQRTLPHLHLPEGLTREDYEELNKGKTAVNPNFKDAPSQSTPFPCVTRVGQSLQGTSEDTEAFMTAFLAGESNQALNAAREGLGCKDGSKKATRRVASGTLIGGDRGFVPTSTSPGLPSPLA